MKTFLTLPKDSEFFNRYARLIPALKWSGYLGQIVSALTELSVIYTAIYASLIFFSPKLAPAGAGIGAVIGVAIIEIGLRVLLPYSIRAVLYRRFAGLDLSITVIVFVACAVLLSAGTLMSYHGSRDVVDTIKPKPKLVSNSRAERDFQNAENSTLQTYRADSTEIVQRYNIQIEATKAQYVAAIAQANGRIQTLEAKEKNGQRFSTAKAQAREQVAALQAEQAGKLAALEGEKGKELGVATNRKNQALAKATTALEKSKKVTDKANTETLTEGKRKTNRYKGGLSWFTIICHLVLVVSIAVDEIHKKGSGIEQRVVPTQYDFSDSMMGELAHALSCRWNQFIRERIRRIEERTPPPPLPLSPNELYSLDNLQQPVFKVNFEQLPDAYQNITVPNRMTGHVPPSAAPPPQSNTSTPAPQNNGQPGNGQARRSGNKVKIAPDLLNANSSNGNGNGKHP